MSLVSYNADSGNTAAIQAPHFLIEGDLDDGSPYSLAPVETERDLSAEYVAHVEAAMAELEDFESFPEFDTVEELFDHLDS